ncbi:zinc finger protein 431-like isoform X2 [Uranotaenia lowii]|uniref:zinc finger protein 431-like isoform X2 n=1 Tax=Uranotaenia lowii TaxID=190385 RepID=UPI002479A438|nr:zinc finger protein 431-like isoform X2 [Uranotaenia lowii]
MNSKIQWKCRVCFVDTRDLETQSIYSYPDSNQSLNFHSMLATICSDVFKSSNDQNNVQDQDQILQEAFGLPENLCKECCKRVENAFQLVELCTETNLRFWRILFKDKQETTTIAGRYNKKPVLEEVELLNEAECSGTENIDKSGHGSSDDFLDSKLAIIEKTQNDSDLEQFDRDESELGKELPLRVTRSRCPNLKCDICPFETKLHKTLQDHMKECHGAKVINCEQCDMVFVSEDKFEAHVESHSQTKDTQQNKNSFGDSSSKLHHAVKVHRKSSAIKNKTTERTWPCLRCDICPYESMFPQKVQDHIRFLHAEQTIGCDKCPLVFLEQKKMEHHKTLHTSGRFYECYLCPKTFSAPIAVRSHLETTHSFPRQEAKTGIKQLKQYGNLKIEEIARAAANNAEWQWIGCDFCDFQSKYPRTMQTHLKNNHDANILQCNTCELVFATQEKLDRHMDLHEKGTIYQCHLCPKAWATMDSLRYHLRRVHSKNKSLHERAREFLCSICGRAFENVSSLNVHAIRHTGVKSSSCPQCPFKTITRGSLKMHMLTHTKERRFKCELCDKAFTTSFSLKLHTRTHTGERPYSCSSCDKSFYTSDHLKRHVRSHTGDKPFKCFFCERKFSQSNDLVKHSRVHFNGNPYPCDRCDEAFRLLTELRNHYKVHFSTDGTQELADGAEEVKFNIVNMLRLRLT